ncbi:phosphate ABC transporter ATP-binding protein PstB [Treponema phagedenis]|uniref:Phosphate ABC transporter ATP-binding protein n=1 Tax=Treponema phagedenis TaxID=162 RepID=A0A0B7GTL9_TREPH|nr:phosphate ABC transporter ATP-binding protein PstB [Treponema phagedenis]QEJ94938.1 phosphate ABC transporter ATP-binding protein [Treponema phagedenis]QEJ98334.1 phosphate ABC transporter ATP-binding protein [Treponema phagedenis]QEK00839.1 phosphate ABC transporter ATP-binding protein [Treponema phagedenis]QEK03844.1 phosphate ABC transporter ATP-binding protein [Treponema phagedenis]QEK05846.1 phosphate ABC transporter ATP-binding protein [Treponema phagedenis]
MNIQTSKIYSQNLNLWYGDTHALKNITIEIKPNTITALIGPSGCGKSSFLRTLNRMNDLVDGVKIEGNIFYNGEDIYSGNIETITLRKNVGMVFQKPNPFPMSIYDNIAYGPRIHGIKKKKDLDVLVEESLKKAALFDEVKDRLKSPATALSGGQQQRLCIARVLAVNPDVILMDEPTSALDPLSTAKIEELIQELKKRLTIVIVTHNMAQAGRASDMTGFFLLGELIEYSPTKELFIQPKNKKTEKYISGQFG